MARKSVRPLGDFVEVQLSNTWIQIWQKDEKDSYTGRVLLSLDAEAALLEVLLARRNARLAEMRTS
jgi:hypothetical protein